MNISKTMKLLSLVCAGALIALAPAVRAADVNVLEGMSLRVERAIQVANDGAIQVELAKCESRLQTDPKDGLALYYKGLILLNKASNLPGGDEVKEQRKALFTKAADALEKSLAARPSAETKSLLAASLERSIAVRGGLSMMSLGPKAVKLHDEAIEAEPENPRILILRGSSLLYRPGFVGGSAEKALESFKKAIPLFEAEAKLPADALTPHWGLAEAWAWVGQAEAKLGHKEQARAAYARALELAPEYGWVKHFLLPSLDS